MMARGEVLYQIRDWDLIYENAGTRKLKTLHWVPTPNKYDGEGFGRIFEELDGCALYGAWHLILQVASKCEPRGTLCRRDGTPLDARAISLKTKAPEAIIARALIFFSTTVDWLLGESANALGESANVLGESANGAQVPPEQGVTETLGESANALGNVVTEWNGIEGNGREGNDDAGDTICQNLGTSEQVPSIAHTAPSGDAAWISVAVDLTGYPLPTDDRRKPCLADAKALTEHYGGDFETANRVLSGLKGSIRYPSRLLAAAVEAIGGPVSETVEEQAARIMGESP